VVVQRLLSLIKELKDDHEKLSSACDYLLDSGISSHMTGNINLLKNFCDVPPVPITMPNGAIAFASK